MEYSAFTSYGQLEFTSDLPDAEKIYNSIRASYTDPKTGIAAVDLTTGSYHEAKVYARAMAIADANASSRRAGNQGDPLKATESIPHFESSFRISPRPTASIEERRAAIAARQLISRGSRRESIYDAMTRILGAALIAIRPVASEEATSWPSDPGSGPGVFGRSDQPAKVVRLTDPVTYTGYGGSTVSYENWDTSKPPIQLAKGDVLSIQPENLGLAEKVTLTGVSGTGATRSLSASFTKAHDLGASASTGPVPIWSSPTGHLFIVVTAVAALSASLVDQVNEQLTRMVKAGTTWSIVEPTSPGASTIGPFTLGVSPLGTVTIGTIDVIHLDAPFFDLPSPAAGSTAGGTVVTLYGRHLTSATDVKVDGISVAFTVLSDFRLTFTTAAHVNGIVDVTVVTPYGTTTLSNVYEFGIAIASITPSTGPNTGGTAFTLRGYGFLAAIDVSVNGFTLASWTIVDDNTITGTTDAVGGPATINVVVDDGTQTASSPFEFT